MAWCWPNHSVAHAIGGFIFTEVHVMTNTPSNEAADSGTIRPGVVARRAAVARAQAELIEMLARLVMAAVEIESAATPPRAPHATHVRRARQSRAGTA
jgi:hypothetical protein